MSSKLFKIKQSMKNWILEGRFFFSSKLLLASCSKNLVYTSFLVILCHFLSFYVILCRYWFLLVVLGRSWSFLVILGYSWSFLVVIGCSCSFLVILCCSCLSLLKPNYLCHHFYLPKVIIQVQKGNGVLKRVISCIKCMELACWVLQASLNLYYYLR